MSSFDSGLWGALLGSIFGFITTNYHFNQKLNAEINLLKAQQLEKILILINKLLHDVDITLKAYSDFFEDPEKYREFEQKYGDYDEINFNRYYRYKGNENKIFEIEFYSDFQLLKSYIHIYSKCDLCRQKIASLEEVIIEINPILELARQTDDFSELKKGIELVQSGLMTMEKIFTSEINALLTDL